ncbi:MAG: hypothetical protein E7521_04020 [Ruminococcaceae bacterium]|nr:hypothetical protein [Oscillospiraceae bacterium]
MTLKTSSRKINRFWNMIGFTLRKNLGIIVVLCIAALLYYPGTFIVNYEDLLVSAENNRYNYMMENFGNIVTVFAALIAIFFNTINFGFLYKKNSSDVFHSFPLTRSELLLSRLLSGIFATLIPVAICYTAYGILMAFNGWMGSFAQLFYYLLHTVIIMLVCSSFSMIFVISAGSMFDLGVSLIGANLALIAVGWIFEAILDETLVGFNGYQVSDIIYNLSPPYFCGVGLGLANDILQSKVNGQSIEFLIRSVIYIAAFTTASLLLYNRRKAEKGGTGYAYKFMYLGCSLLAGICGGYLLGMMFTGNFASFGFWFFAVVGCLLTSVIYGTVTNRGFKGIGKSLIMGGVSAVVLISVAVSGITGGFGYTTRIPKKDKIKSVSISAFNENITFDNPQMALDLHSKILDSNATEYDVGVSYRYIDTIYFYYELENGKMLSREFTVEEAKVAEQLLAIYKSKERLNMINEHINVVNAENISLYFHYNGEYYDTAITHNEAQIFLEAYWQDVQNSDASIFNNDSYEFLEITGYEKIVANRENYFNFQLEWHDSFKNTNQFILDYDLVERAKQQKEDYEKY